LGELEAGQPVQWGRIGKRLLASEPSPVPWYIPASDAIAAGKPADSDKVNVEIHFDDPSFRNRILIAGCDPGNSVLARHTQAAGVELVLAHRNSSQVARSAEGELRPYRQSASARWTERRIECTGNRAFIP
jgi:hypothetical protein